jgi:hypothetical protein
LLFGAPLLVVLLAGAPAHATEYWKPDALLGNFFLPAAKTVSYKTVTLTGAAAAEIARKLGADVKSLKRTWNVYFGLIDGKRTGYAILDAEIGLHDDIDFGVRFGLAGAVERVEIMVYREAYGDQVRGERFRKQFAGKTADDPITAGKDIDIVSGATYSSKSLALGIKRDALVLQYALKNGLLQ